jgi:hypothetical protein
MQMFALLPTMAAIKVWAEACFAVSDNVGVAHVKKVLADVAETEAIIAAYGEGVLAETRREAREARAAAARGAGGVEEKAVDRKSKAAKRKQQKRKAQQQKKKEAEAAAAAAAERAVGEDQGTTAVEEASRILPDGGTLVEEGRQQQIGDLAAATLGLALQEELGAGENGEEEKEEEEGEEEEECSVCLCVILGSDDRESRLLCKHVYHSSCLELWQKNCVKKASSRHALTAGRRCSLRVKEGGKREE